MAQGLIQNIISIHNNLKQTSKRRLVSIQKHFWESKERERERDLGPIYIYLLSEMSYNYLKILGGLLYLEYVCKRLFGVHIKLVLHITQKFSGFRHLQRIWGASGNLWQNTWNRVYLAFGENDLLIGLFGEYMIVSFRIIRVLNTCVLLLLYMRNAR